MLVAGSLQFGVNAADHGDAPGVRVDNRLDINDVYAFQSPSQSGNVVFIMTVSPAARILSQNHFNPRGNYDFFVNTNADPNYEFSPELPVRRPRARRGPADAFRRGIADAAHFRRRGGDQ